MANQRAAKKKSGNSGDNAVTANEHNVLPPKDPYYGTGGLSPEQVARSKNANDVNTNVGSLLNMAGYVNDEYVVTKKMTAVQPWTPKGRKNDTNALKGAGTKMGKNSVSGGFKKKSGGAKTGSGKGGGQANASKGKGKSVMSGKGKTK